MNRAGELTSGRNNGARRLSLHSLLRSPTLPLVVLCILSGCVSLDQLPPGSVPNMPTSGPTASTYPDLDPGNVSVTSMHFTLKGYSQSDLDSLKQMAETLYNKIGNDTGLYSFLASESFTWVAYRDRDEYMKKTHQPTWSHAVTSGKSIYFYFPDPELEPILAHHMVHVIFEDYMGTKASTNRWLEEGLAMVEELSKMSDGDKSSYAASKASQLRQNRMAFSQMTFFVTNTEEKRRTDSWYQQVESVVNYLLAQGSALAFAQMLSELRAGLDFDRAMADAYPAKFRSLNDLEAAWKYTI